MTPNRTPAFCRLFISGIYPDLTSGEINSHVVIHREFVGMRTETESIVFLLLHLDPVLDEVDVEDVAFQQERMICVQCGYSAAERIRHAWNLREFFRWKFVQVLVQRIAGIDSVLD